MTDNKKSKQKARGFSDIPTDVVERIVGNLGSVDKLFTRKVCRKLRSIIDNQSSKFDEISLRITENACEIQFEHQKLKYSGKKNGKCFLNFRRHSEDPFENYLFEALMPPQKIVSLKGDPWMMALKEFASVITHPKWSFKKLKLEFKWEENEEQDHPKPFLHLNSLLSDHKIHVEQLQIKGFTLLPAATLLPHFQPISLKSLYLDFDDLDENVIGVIQEMDQWKNVKQLKMAFIPNWFSIENLFYAMEFQVLSSGITEERIGKIRDILFKSPTFQSCSLGYCSCNSDMEQDEILNVTDRIMGAHTAYKPRNRRYQIDGSHDHFEISLNNDEEDGWLFLEFKRKTPPS